MAKNSLINQFWIDGPRFIAVGMFTYSIIGKIISPSSFYTIVNSLNLHISAPEIFLSIFITVELSMVWMLIYNPDEGIYYSSGVSTGSHEVEIFHIFASVVRAEQGNLIPL
jgi:hypothetical protein